MIPLKDDNPIRIFPAMTILIIIINVLVFIFQLTMTARAEWIFLHRFGVIPRAITHFIDPFPLDGMPVILTLGTSVFLHGGLLHLAGNMLFLWIFGNNIEDALGHLRFILFYFFCGTAATLVYIATNPGSITPLVGASGAIAGIMGTYLVLFPRARVLTLILIIFYPVFVWVPAVFFLFFWFLLQFLNSGGVGEGNVAWTAHIGGFICGIIAIKLLMKGRPTPRLNREPPRRGFNP